MGPRDNHHTSVSSTLTREGQPVDNKTHSKSVSGDPARNQSRLVTSATIRQGETAQRASENIPTLFLFRKFKELMIAKTNIFLYYLFVYLFSQYFRLNLSEARVAREFLSPSPPFLPAPPERTVLGELRNAESVSLKESSNLVVNILHY